jgi:hypothetical protein
VKDGVGGRNQVVDSLFEELGFWVEVVGWLGIDSLDRWEWTSLALERGKGVAWCEEGRGRMGPSCREERANDARPAAEE